VLISHDGEYEWFETIQAEHLPRLLSLLGADRHALFEQLLRGTEHDAKDIASLVRVSERKIPLLQQEKVERCLLAAPREGRRRWPTYVDCRIRCQGAERSGRSRSPSMSTALDDAA